MAYTIRIDGVTVLNQRSVDKAYQVTSPTWKMELKKSDALTFTLPYGNAGYDAPKELESDVVMREDGEIVFRGRVRSVKRTLYGDKLVTCEGDLGFLRDSKLPPFHFQGMDQDFCRYILAQHNARVDTGRQILDDYIAGGQGTTWLDVETEDYMSSFDALMTYWRHDLSVSEQLQACFLRTTWTEENGRVISHLTARIVAGADWVDSVRIGKNLLDIAAQTDTDDVYTVIIPLGADVDTGETDADGNAIREPLTIKSVNGGKEYLEAPSDVLSQYGRIWKDVSFRDIGPDDETTETEAAQALKEAGEEELEANIAAALSITATAIDLKMAGFDAKGFKLGYPTTVSHPLLGIDEPFQCVKIELKLANPERSKYSFGLQRTTMTGQLTGAARAAAQAQRTAEKASSAAAAAQRTADSKQDAMSAMSSADIDAICT